MHLDPPGCIGRRFDHDLLTYIHTSYKIGLLKLNISKNLVPSLAVKVCSLVVHEGVICMNSAAINSNCDVYFKPFGKHQDELNCLFFVNGLCFSTMA